MISVLCVAGCVFAFVYAGMVWGIVTIVAAAAFFALCVLFKKLQEDKGKKQSGDNASSFIGNAQNSDKTDTDEKNGN